MLTAGREGEVRRALAAAGVRARRCVDVTTMIIPSVDRRTYRVHLDSGATIKARCLESAAAARQLFEQRRGLADAFAPAFARHQRVLLEAWITGRVVGTRAPDPRLLAQAGVLLAGLHQTRVNTRARTARTASWRARANGWLKRLLAESLLNRREVAAVRAALARDDPGRARICLGHFDFCGENMVVDNHGQLRVVDNERVGVGPVGFDLARTWYRWRLSATTWRVFHHAYSAGGGVVEPPSALAFWQLIVVLQSAFLRADASAHQRAIPLAKLRRLANRPA